MNRLVTIAVAVCVVATHATADAPQSANGKTYSHALQVEAIKAIWNQYSVKYEYLVNEKHGIVLEGAYKNNSSGNGHWLGMSYRRHKKNTMQGGFWGFFVTYKEYDDEYKEEIDGRTHTYPFSISAWSVGPNIGHRWILGSGISFVWRFGFGVPIAKLEWRDGEPEENRRLVEGLFKFFQGVDGELSIGYCF